MVAVTGTIDIKTEPLITNEVEPAGLEANKSQETTIVQRTLNFGSDLVSGVWNTSKNTLRGAAIWTGALGVATGGTSLQILYYSVFNPEIFEPKGDQILQKQQELYEGAKKLERLFPLQDLYSWWYFNPEKILAASCPKQEYYEQISLLTGFKMTPLIETISVIGGMVIAIPINEELIFRGALQDLLLKRLVKKVVVNIAPQHADKVDSNIYTGIRILLTSAAFSYSHTSNAAFMTDSYVAKQVFQTFFLGLGWGALKEKYGIASSTGAHMIHNLVATLPGMTKC